MILLIFLAPLALLIFFRKATVPVFVVVSVIALLAVVAGNKNYLALDLVGYFVVLAAVIFHRWDNARPRLTPEQKEVRERQQREAELVRQKQAATLANMRRRALNFGLLIMIFVFIADQVIKGVSSESPKFILALMAGGCAYVMRLIYLVNRNPEVNLNQDIAVALVLIVVPVGWGLIFFAPILLNKLPIDSSVKSNEYQDVPIASVPSYIHYSKEISNSRSASEPKLSIHKKQAYQPNVDLRHCMDLNSDAEIAQCAN